MIYPIRNIVAGIATLDEPDPALAPGFDVVDSLVSGDEPELGSPHVFRDGGGVPFPFQHALMDKVAREGLSTFLRQSRLRARQVEAVLRCGDPAREIAAEGVAWKADLLVVGTQSRKAPEQWFLGSVAAASIRGAVGSVPVIPAQIEEQRTLSSRYPTRIPKPARQREIRRCATS